MQLTPENCCLKTKSPFGDKERGRNNNLSCIGLVFQRVSRHDVAAHDSFRYPDLRFLLKVCFLLLPLWVFPPLF